MRPLRFAEEQTSGMQKEQEAGAKTADVCREHGISAATFYKFKTKFGGMEVSDARRLKGSGGRERPAYQLELGRVVIRFASVTHARCECHSRLEIATGILRSCVANRPRSIRSSNSLPASAPIS